MIGYIKRDYVGSKWKSLFSVIGVERFEYGYVLKLPDIVGERQLDKAIHGLIKIIQKLKIETVVFAEDLKEVEELFQMRAIQIGIIKGKKIMESMKLEIMQYIFRIQNRNMKQDDIHIVIHKEPSLNLNFIGEMIENFKTVNIVTNDIERFKSIQENLYDNEDILISVSNNKKKALKKAKYIMNVNLNKKELEKYKINRHAILIHLREVVKYGDNTFDGINVNGIKIHVPDEILEKYETVMRESNFDYAQLYESFLYHKLSNIEVVEKHIKQDEIKVEALIGNNGKINQEELISNSEINCDFHVKNIDKV